MIKQEENLDKRRANCRIWAHILFWFVIPFGPIISAVKMRSIFAAFIFWGIMSLSALTNPLLARTGLESWNDEVWNDEVMDKVERHGYKFYLISGLLGSGFTVYRIIESRKNTQDLD